MAISAAVLAALGGVALAAQDKFRASAGWLAFSDFGDTEPGRPSRRVRAEPD